MNKLLLSAIAMLGGAALLSPFVASAAELEPGQFVRATDGTVYWLSEDERRYVFPDGATLQSWLGGTPGMLKDATDGELEPFPVGGPMTMRPGTRLVKFVSDETVYAVTRGAALRAVAPEYATAYYGAGWMQNVDVLSIALYPNYKVGMPIEKVSDFDRMTEVGFAATPETDLRMKRENGLLPRSTAPLKAEVKFTVTPTVVHPPEAPTAVAYTVTITKPNTAISNLRTDIFRDNGAWQKACRGIDRCHYEIDYKDVTKAAAERYYALVSNEKAEVLQRVYSPFVTIAPVTTSMVQ
ncbi:hypothetical protein M0Q28_03260 [Patescibacteria group bacterium]|jgi:hypothetical protein|nr:hypothetical protein [Patescibacteria group bacterium]